MDDLISRQAAIDTLAEWNDAAITNRLNNLPSAQPTDAEIQRMQDIEQAMLDKAYECGKQDAMQWIPCSERLPEEEKAYLVTFACEKVGMSSWHKDTLYNRGFDVYMTGVTEDGECEYFGVVAWMEKPEPWKGGEE